MEHGTMSRPWQRSGALGALLSRGSPCPGGLDYMTFDPSNPNHSMALCLGFYVLANSTTSYVDLYSDSWMSVCLILFYRLLE